MNLHIFEYNQVTRKSLEVAKVFESTIKTRNRKVESRRYHNDLYLNGANFVHIGLKITRLD